MAEMMSRADEPDDIFNSDFFANNSLSRQEDERNPHCASSISQAMKAILSGQASTSGRNVESITHHDHSKIGDGALMHRINAGLVAFDRIQRSMCERENSGTNSGTGAISRSNENCETQKIGAMGATYVHKFGQRVRAATLSRDDGGEKRFMKNRKMKSQKMSGLRMVAVSNGDELDFRRDSDSDFDLGKTTMPLTLKVKDRSSTALLSPSGQIRVQSNALKETFADSDALLFVETLDEGITYEGNLSSDEDGDF